MRAGRLVGLALLASVAAIALLSQRLVAAPESSTRQAAGGSATAIFASGCFWCTESDFEKLPGVIDVVSGYIGGQVANPSYKQVSAGVTGHAEAVRISYDPARVSYQALLDHYWKNVDPTVKDQQFCDRGNQYRSAIFVLDEAQRQAAEASREALAKSGRFARIYTEIVPATTFYEAEDYHQDYYRKNPIRYHYYRSGCGRDARLAELWGKP